MQRILIIAGPTASGKSACAVAEALAQKGEIISVDSRQVYRGLDIGTEKITKEEMRGVPHHLIDIRDPSDAYSAGDFVTDADKLIQDITARGKLPILAGGSHFYFDALLYGLPEATPKDAGLRAKLEALPNGELLGRIEAIDPRRAKELDPYNRRRLIRALEIIAAHGKVPNRSRAKPRYEVNWIMLDPPADELSRKIEQRLAEAFSQGLIDEVRRVRDQVGDERLDELGLEYRAVGEHLRGERSAPSLPGHLRSKLRNYARHQRAWLRKLGKEAIAEAPSRLSKN